MTAYKPTNSDPDDTLYKQAMNRVDELVEEVFQICDDVADESKYDRDWVLERFREKFSAAKRKRRK